MTKSRSILPYRTKELTASNQLSINISLGIKYKPPSIISIQYNYPSSRNKHNKKNCNI